MTLRIKTSCGATGAVFVPSWEQVSEYCQALQAWLNDNPAEAWAEITDVHGETIFKLVK